MAAIPPPTNPYYHSITTPAVAARNDNGSQIVVAAQTVPQWGDVLSPAAPATNGPAQPSSSNGAVPVAVAVANNNAHDEEEIVVPPINPLSGEPLSATTAESSDAAATTTETQPPPTSTALALIGSRLEQERADRELAERLQREEEEQGTKIPPQQQEHQQQQLVAYQSNPTTPIQADFSQTQKLAKLKERRKTRQAVAAGTGTIVGGLLLGPLGAVVVGVSAHQVTKHTGRAAEKRVRKKYEKREELKALKEDVLS